MFYSVFVLGKKGPLARVWLAAHWDKKITKAQILETNIVESVDSILQPKVKLSLRTSSHLLLGIVRIYARKTLYLLQDCQDAAFKIKSAFRPGAVDLPDGKTEAAISAITLPEMLDFINDFDLIAEPPMQMEPTATTANIRSITLVEDVSNVHVDNALMQGLRDWSDISSIHAPDGTVSGDLLPLGDDFGAELGAGLFEEDEPPPEAQEAGADQTLLPEHQPRSVQRPASAMSDRSDSMSYGAPASMAPSGPPSTPGSVPPMDAHEDEEMPFAAPSLIDETQGRDGMSLKVNDIHGTMVLDPIDAQGLEKRRKRRKKLGVLIDEVKTLSGEEMKAQLSDTSDIITTLDLAPPSKKLMHWKKTGTAEKMFVLPERLMPSQLLLVFYSRHLITKHIDAEEDMLPELTNGHEMAAPLPVLDDIEEQLPQLSPIHDLQPPKTPKTPSYTRTPPKKKRKTDDKKSKENIISNHVSRLEEHDSRMSSIHDMRAGSLQTSDAFAPSYQLDFQDEDDDDDYGAPMSVGPPEPMFEGETDEQIEERITKRRTEILLRIMVTKLEEEGQLLFSNLVRSNRRKQVAQKFFSLLVLKKQQAIELTQDPDIPYAEIYIGKGLRYEESLLSSSVA